MSYRGSRGRAFLLRGAIAAAATVCLSTGLLGAASSPPTGTDAPFTIVVMPDTQYYTLTEDRSERYFDGQTRWIVANRQKENIVFVSHEGDLQQDGTFLRLDQQYDPLAKPLIAHADPQHPPLNVFQWQRADAAMKILDDAGIPYVAVAGNHDYMHWDRKTLPTLYLHNFGPGRYAGKSWFGGSSPGGGYSPAGMNMYQYFTADGVKYLSIGLEFAPDPRDLAWAQKVVEANPGLPTIITTHGYMNNKGFDPGRRNIWNLLVKKESQIFLVLCGHINGHNRVTEKDDAGLDVYEVMVDYQDLKVPGYYKGGGYMRLMRFDPAHNEIDVKTYSPVTEKFLDNDKDQFTLHCDFKARFAAMSPRNRPATMPSATR